VRAGLADHGGGAMTTRTSSTQTAAKDGLRADPRIRLEALDHLARDGVAEHPLDVAEQTHLVDAYE
jgi:hypothetical protein